MSYPIPNRRGEVASGASPVLAYKLTAVELTYLHGGALDKIPTADRRNDVTVDGEAVERIGRPAQRDTKRQKHNVTREQLRDLREAGKTVDQIAEQLGIPRGTISTLVKLYGLTRGGKHKRGAGG